MAIGPKDLINAAEKEVILSNGEIQGKVGYGSEWTRIYP